MCFYKFLLILAIVESGDKPVVGDNGRAIGPLQIHIGVVQDVNRISGSDYTGQDRWSKISSITIASAYLRYWGQHYRQITGKRPTWEIYARIWNGGPNGWRKPLTDKYWQKVQHQIQKEK